MKIFGFDIDIDSDRLEVYFREAISAVMLNTRISIESGINIVQQLLNQEISEEQLYAYVLAQDTTDVVPNEYIFAHLDRWQEVVGTFSKDDIIYLNSLTEQTKEYQTKPNDIQSIVNYICHRVVGQDAAIKTIVTAVWLHCTSVRQNLGLKVPAQLLVGQTGVGKTQILNLLSEVLNVPIIHVFGSMITAPGYKGGDSLMDQIFSQYSNFDTLNTASAPIIICIHEIDKAVRGDNVGYRVELLSSVMAIIEQNVIHKANPMGGSQSLDLKNVLVLFDGCFDGIEKFVARRLGLNRVGFNQGNVDSMHNLRINISKADLLEYGMIKEFIGRISNPICLNDMTVELMYNILAHSIESPIASYANAFKHYGIHLKFSKEALKAISHIAFENQIFGARSLETIVNEIMEPYTIFLTIKSRKNILIGKRDVYRIMSKDRISCARRK